MTNIERAAWAVALFATLTFSVTISKSIMPDNAPIIARMAAIEKQGDVLTQAQRDTFSILEIIGEHDAKAHADIVTDDIAPRATEIEAEWIAHNAMRMGPDAVKRAAELSQRIQSGQPLTRSDAFKMQFFDGLLPLKIQQMAARRFAKDNPDYAKLFNTDRP